MKKLRVWAHHDGRPRRVVIAGGGVAGLESAIMLRTLAPEICAVTLICRENTFQWRARRVAEPFGTVPGDPKPLAGMCAAMGANFIRDSLHTVRRETRDVLLKSGFELEYDALLVAIGADPYPAFDAGFTFGVSSVGDPFEEVIEDLDQGLVESVAFVVAPGVSWPLPAYELALLSAARRADLKVSLVTPEQTPLALFGPAASEAVADVLAAAGVAFVHAAAPQVASDTTVRIDGRWLVADRVVSLPLLAGPRTHGVPFDEKGFILVDADQSVPGCDGRVFAAGDGCATPVKQGAVAAQQAELATSRILALAGIETEPAPDAPPVLRAALTTSDGPLYLLCDPKAPELTSRATRTAPAWAAEKVAAPWLSRYLGSVRSSPCQQAPTS